MTRPHPVATFPALGSTAALLVTDPRRGPQARRILEEQLSRIDLACSRFRKDSELVRLNARAGQGPVEVSPLLLEAVETSLRAARLTDGLVDPTVGTALELIGYDRDFAAIAPDGPALAYRARAVPGWATVTVGRRAGVVALAAGTRLDLGATAKALCADLAAAAIAEATGSGVLVGLGGDIAVAGPPPEEGWSVKISLDHAAPLDGPGPVVGVTGGGLATSSTAVRTWRRGGREVHHLIDPGTSRPVAAHWRAASVAAGSCVDANIASCAAMVMGPAAVGWLGARALPARLVGIDGEVTTVAGWPADEAVACS